MNIFGHDDAKSRILRAGRDLFAEQGYSSVTVREITARAGVNQAMISYYFGGKEALYGEVLSREFSYILSLFDLEHLAYLTPRERLKAFADTIDDLHRERPWIASLVHQEVVWPTRFLDESVIPALKTLASFLEEAIREGMQRGDFRADLNSPTTVYALAAIVNYQHIFRPLVSRILPDGDDGEDRTDKLLDIFFRGVDPRDR